METNVVTARLYYPVASNPTIAVYIDTCDNWNNNIDIMSKKGSIYVYSDYETSQGKDFPAIKIGDGKSYLIDLPFVYGGNDLKGYTNIHINTTDEWNSKASMISTAGDVYVYSDGIEDGDSSYPAIKIGDGTSYIIDLPYVYSPVPSFITSKFELLEEKTNEHILNTAIHVSEEDRANWNSKLKVSIDSDTLIFTE